MEIIKEKTFQILFHDADRNGLASMNSICCYLQATADSHSRSLGTSLRDFHANNQTWVYSRFHVKMDTFPGYYDIIHIETWRSEIRGALAFREYQVRDADKKIIGAATASIALINIEKRKPVKIPDNLRDQFTPHRGRAINDEFEKFPIMEEVQTEKNFAVRMSDIDANNHVNNVSYIDWITESVPRDILLEYSPHEIEIDYRAEAFYGNTITSASSMTQDNEEKKFLHSLSLKESGLTTTLARTAWKIIPV